MKMQNELTYRLIYEMCKRIHTLEDDLAAEQALNNSLINFDVVETKALNDAQKEYIRQQDERICKLEEENAKLREFASEAFSMAFYFYHGAGTAEDLRELKIEYHELGIEVPS